MQINQSLTNIWRINLTIINTKKGDLYIGKLDTGSEEGLEEDVLRVALEGMRAKGGGMAGEGGFGMGPTGQMWERTAWAEDWTLERKELMLNWREFGGGFWSWLVGFWETKGKGIFVIFCFFCEEERKFKGSRLLVLYTGKWESASYEVTEYLSLDPHHPIIIRANPVEVKCTGSFNTRVRADRTVSI